MKWEVGLTLFGFVLLGVGHGLGLFVAPPEAMMGDVGRILYVHVPTAWVALVTYLLAFIGAIGVMLNGKLTWDAFVESATEVGVLLNGMLLIQGSIWARPTWGIWWTWDPRLTTSAVLLMAFSAILVLRRLIDAPERRMTIGAVSTIVAFVNVPIVYFSVKWWRTLHQPFSSPKTVDAMMVLPLRIAAFGMLFLSIGFIVARWRIAKRRLEVESDTPDMPALPPAMHIEEVR